MNSDQLAGWTPVRLYWRDSAAFVDWCHLGGTRFTAPFFEQTINEAMRRPFSLLFRPQTSADVLVKLSASHPGRKPAGFIFHMSRCGSTLVSQMLAAAPENIVISEAAPIDFALRAQTPAGISEAQRIEWLRGIITALLQSREPQESYGFIKFDAWHILQLPLIRRAFPDVPWIFLYRDPVEVLVSHRREPGGQTVPGVLDPGTFGIDPAALPAIPPDEYCAHVLARILEAALAFAGEPQGRLLNYTQLPEAVVPDLLEFFGVSYSPTSLHRMRAAAQANAKAPSFAFSPDSDSKQQEADERTRQLAHQWVEPAYRQLETRRQESSGRAKSDGHAR